MESSLGRIDYERKEKGFISADGLGGGREMKKRRKSRKAPEKEEVKKKKLETFRSLENGL